MKKPILISVATEAEPITRTEAKLAIRVDSSIEDSLIDNLIKDARELCEEELELSLVEKTWEVAQDSLYPSTIELPYGPVRSITSFTYVDTGGADTLLAADQYRLDAYVVPTVLVPAYDVTWPDVRNDTNSVRVRYVAGYPSTDSPPEQIPGPVRRAMLLLIGHLYEHREGVDDERLMELPLGVRYMLSKYRAGLGV